MASTLIKAGGGDRDLWRATEMSINKITNNFFLKLGSDKQKTECPISDNG